MSRHRAQTRSTVHTGLTVVAAGSVLAVGTSGVATATGMVPTATADPTAVVRLAAEADAGFTNAEADAVLANAVRASLVPVAEAAETAPELDVSGLLKAAGFADIAHRTEERDDCDADLDGLGRVKPHVRDATRFLSCLYDEPTVIGVARRSRHSDHPGGRAVDLMMRGERGDRLAECALENQDELGISYVIWKQRVNHGKGWKRMSDRGGDTANHYDHVHISFDRATPEDDPLAERCD